MTAQSPDRPSSITPPRSVLFAFRVLEAVAEFQPVSLHALSQYMDAPKTTTLRALRALHAAGYAVQETGVAGSWRLTLRALRLHTAAADQGGLVAAARPEMHRLLDLSDEAIHLTVLDNFEVVVIDKLDSTQAVRAYTALGDRLPPHASGTGKALLSELDDPELARFLSRPLARFTERTITDPDVLRSELVKVRAQGFGINDGERRADVVGIGSCIRDSLGVAIAGIGVTVPRHRAGEGELDRFIRECMKSAAEVSRRMGRRDHQA